VCGLAPHGGLPTGGRQDPRRGSTSRCVWAEEMGVCQEDWGPRCRALRSRPRSRAALQGGRGGSRAQGRGGQNARAGQQAALPLMKDRSGWPLPPSTSCRQLVFPPTAQAGSPFPGCHGEAPYWSPDGGAQAPSALSLGVPGAEVMLPPALCFRLQIHGGVLVHDSQGMPQRWDRIGGCSAKGLQDAQLAVSVLQDA